MRIIYSGVRNEHYVLQRGKSFEYNNFYLALKNMPDIEVIEYPFDAIVAQGRRVFNDNLLELVRKERPDLVFCFMYTDELDPRVLMEIKKYTKTIAWFADDYWRFWNYSRRWAPYFSSVVTTSHEAFEWYHAEGHRNVILSQWACNTALYAPRDVSRRDIDVSFIGQYKPVRAAIIKTLSRAGIRVEAFGFGWPNGRVSQDRMLDIFSRSKINLNLNVRPHLWEPRILARLFLKKSITRLVPDFHFLDNFSAYRHVVLPHIHARPFELAGCGAFVISGYAAGIENYYVPDTEMVFYRSHEELIEKINYYLSHDEGRERIARAGYERTLRDHTYERRFEKIFNIIHALK